MMIGITFKQAFKYTALPGIAPRMRELFGSGFSHIAFFMALVYGAVRLLPNNHPYLQAKNIGRFNIAHVLAEAANHLHMSFRNIDQIILFFTILFGLAIGIVQIIILALSLFVDPVIAAPLGFKDLFVTPHPKEDLAFMFMDMVFGVPDIFNSCISLKEPCLDVSGNVVDSVTNNWEGDQLGFPYPIHHALHNMLRVYNLGLLLVAVIITCYFVVTVLMETAQTGTPFGKRFNKVWAPIRLVVAFGLLIPLGIGLNSSQIIVLHMAKLGSSFATNGWNLFNQTLIDENIKGTVGAATGSEMIARPNIPEITGLLQFLYTARVCSMIEQVKDNKEIKPYLVRDVLDGVENLEITFNTSYKDMMTFVNQDTQNLDSKVVMRFGTRGNSDIHKLNKGNVIPICGELLFKLSDPLLPSASPAKASQSTNKGVHTMQRYYWFAVREIWFKTLLGETPDTGFEYAINKIDDGVNYPVNFVKSQMGEDLKELEKKLKPDKKTPLPNKSYPARLTQFYETDVQAAMLDPNKTSLSGEINSNIGALAEQAEDGRWMMDVNLRRKGWAGAGIWYNRIAELNGDITSAVLNIPTPTRYPNLMEEVFLLKRQHDQNIKTKTRYEPKLAGDKDINLLGDDDADKAWIMWNAFNSWQSDGASTEPATGNAFVDAINTLFGLDGLFNMRKNENVHPLAQLVGVGRSLVEAAVRNLGNATIVAGGGAILSTVDNMFGSAASIGAGFMVKVATIGLTVGFVLFYIVPFMPFIYFFFAVGGWVKGIFEAMLGAPLWALAHIRIDGNGLPGSAAVDGYFLLFEIFLRPILTVFGLLAAISIFSALVSMLNQIWDMVVNNLGGFDVRASALGVDTGTGEKLIKQTGLVRSAIDEFFFTIVYVIIVYMMGMASFKLIDNIPNNILRWMGKSVSSFNDSRENPAEAMAGKTSIGTQQYLSQIGGGVEGALGKMSTLGNKPPGASG